MKFKRFCCLVIIFITLFMPSYIYAYDTTLENKDYIIFIDINELSLSLLDKETKILVKKYPVAIGKKETPSPIGNWRITSKALKYLNYYSGTVDGIYGYPLELSVRKYKEDHQMDDTPIIDKSFLDSIGVYKFE